MNTITQASEFLSTYRGRLIISQALIIAIRELSNVEGADRQISNIADMQDLLDSDYCIDVGNDERFFDI